jgi:hypothetical protein
LELLCPDASVVHWIVTALFRDLGHGIHEGEQVFDFSEESLRRGHGIGTVKMIPQLEGFDLMNAGKRHREQIPAAKVVAEEDRKPRCRCSGQLPDRMSVVIIARRAFEHWKL